MHFGRCGVNESKSITQETQTKIRAYSAPGTRKQPRNGAPRWCQEETRIFHCLLRGNLYLARYRNLHFPPKIHETSAGHAVLTGALLFHDPSLRLPVCLGHDVAVIRFKTPGAGHGHRFREGRSSHFEIDEHGRVHIGNARFSGAAILRASRTAGQPTWGPPCWRGRVAAILDDAQRTQPS